MAEHPQAAGLPALVIAVTMAGCFMQPVAQLRMVGDPGARAGAAIGDVPYGAPRSVGSIMLCVTANATATVTRVGIHRPQGDIRVDAFALRPNPFTRNQEGLGVSDRTIAEFGNGFVPDGLQQVSGVCPKDLVNDPVSIQSKTSELAVQVSWSSGELAGGRDLEVTYRVGETTQTALVPFGIWLCAATCPVDVGR